jgi:hypothetical protein
MFIEHAVKEASLSSLVDYGITVECLSSRGSLSRPYTLLKTNNVHIILKMCLTYGVRVLRDAVLVGRRNKRLTDIQSAIIWSLVEEAEKALHA